MRRALPLLFVSLAGSCLAPPPPVVVETAFGDVRANSDAKATEVAQLLERLAPEVKAHLPGALDRTVDVWVQDELRVYRFHRRAESVRGFTLLSDEFEAERIHLQESGQSPWYLAHELVHALIGPSWKTLPAILEEGLGDVVAEQLNPEYHRHIRAHRLLNASAFTQGLQIELAHLDPSPNAPRHRWERVRGLRDLTLGESFPPGTLESLLETPRSELHTRWEEIPESFYGIAWLVVSRITERHGLEALHAMCLRAEAEGLDLVPAEWLLTAAEIDPDALDPGFLRSCFDFNDMHAAIWLQPEAFAEVTLDVLSPLQSQFSFRSVFHQVRPAFVLDDGRELPVGLYFHSLYRTMSTRWEHEDVLAAGDF